MSSATGLVRGGDHAAGAFLLKFSDDVALKKAIGAVSVAHDPDELETELGGARLRRSLEALLLRTAELRGSTPPLPHRNQPRGHPTWLPSLSKATTLYPALVDALFAAREWQAGPGWGWCGRGSRLWPLPARGCAGR